MKDTIPQLVANAMRAKLNRSLPGVIGDPELLKLAEHADAMDMVYRSLNTAYRFLIPCVNPGSDGYSYKYEGSKEVVFPLAQFLQAPPAVVEAEVIKGSGPLTRKVPNARNCYQIDTRAMPKEELEDYLIARKAVYSVVNPLKRDGFTCHTAKVSGDAEGSMVFDDNFLELAPGFHYVDLMRLVNQSRIHEVATNTLNSLITLNLLIDAGLVTGTDPDQDNLLWQALTEDARRALAQQVNYDGRHTPPEFIFDRLSQPVVTLIRSAEDKVLGIAFLLLTKHEGKTGMEEKLHWRGAFYDHEDPRTASMGIQHSLMASAIHIAYDTGVILDITEAPVALRYAWEPDLVMADGVETASGGLQDTAYLDPLVETIPAFFFAPR